MFVDWPVNVPAAPTWGRRRGGRAQPWGQNSILSVLIPGSPGATLRGSRTSAGQTAIETVAAELDRARASSPPLASLGEGGFGHGRFPGGTPGVDPGAGRRTTRHMHSARGPSRGELVLLASGCAWLALALPRPLLASDPARSRARVFAPAIPRRAGADWGHRELAFARLAMIRVADTTFRMGSTHAET